MREFVWESCSRTLCLNVQRASHRARKVNVRTSVMIIRTINATSNKFKMVVVTVLGIAQDGGRPQPSCYKSCCSNLTLADVRYPVALGVVNGTTIHLFETSRYLGEQLRFLWKLPASNISENIDHVWITHAHWGHIDGLGLFGRETMNCKGVRLHVSESMASLIRRTPSWNAMVEQGVFIMDIFPNSAHKKAVFRSALNQTTLDSSTLSIEPISIPHRAELSDTHAFIIRGPSKSLLFLPDHDSWEKTLSFHQCTSIRHFLKSFRIDIALIDGTFWSYDELGNIRDQSQVPHPPISETINLLGTRKPEQDPLIYFTHLNHTNPLYDTSSVQYKTLFEMGWDVAHQGMTFAL
jgi:pyrroloquinoline quinone biosynthesis protein B